MFDRSSASVDSWYENDGDLKVYLIEAIRDVCDIVEEIGGAIVWDEHSNDGIIEVLARDAYWGTNWQENHNLRLMIYFAATEWQGNDPADVFNRDGTYHDRLLDEAVDMIREHEARELASSQATDPTNGSWGPAVSLDLPTLRGATPEPDHADEPALRSYLDNACYEICTVLTHERENPVPWETFVEVVAQDAGAGWHALNPTVATLVGQAQETPSSWPYEAFHTEHDLQRALVDRTVEALRPAAALTGNYPTLRSGVPGQGQEESYLRAAVAEINSLLVNELHLVGRASVSWENELFHLLTAAHLNQVPADHATAMEWGQATWYRQNPVQRELYNQAFALRGSDSPEAFFGGRSNELIAAVLAKLGVTSTDESTAKLAAEYLGRLPGAMQAVRESGLLTEEDIQELEAELKQLLTGGTDEGLDIERFGKVEHILEAHGLVEDDV